MRNSTLEATKIGLRIRRVREHQKVSASDIAQKLHMTSDNFLKLERAEHNITVDQLREIAIYLDTPIEIFLDDSFSSSTKLDSSVLCEVTKIPEGEFKEHLYKMIKAYNLEKVVNS
ncbi:MAG: helix-turn-helix domain-containing protein [Candidatus Pacebacteria bacterium]|nr:helix-turn-helix domain-containing protein [Candidatus Paceibacterota bacterium]